MSLGQPFNLDIVPEQHPPVVLQRSEMQQYATCPHQANLCDKHPKAANRHHVLPEVGGIIHTIVKEAIETSDMNLQDAADYVANELPKARPDLQPEVLRAGKSIARELHQFAACQILLCEKAVTRQLLPATLDRGEVLVVTEPDLVLATSKAESIIVPDWKTGYKYRTSQEAQDDFQTCVVSWTLFEKYPSVQTIHFFYINTRLSNRSYAKITRADEDNLQGRIMETARLALDECDEAWPEPTKCTQCDVAKWCKLADGEALDFAKNPKKYLNSFVALSARLEQMETVLRDVVKAGRTIYGTECRYDGEPKKKSGLRPSVKSMKKEGNGNEH